VGHALVVAAGRAHDPGDQAPYSAVLAEHLTRRAATVDVLDGTSAPARLPDLVVGFTSPLTGARTAARIARASGARLVLVVHELLRAPGSGGEREVLRAAVQVAVASEAFRPAVRAYGVPDPRIAILPDWAHVVPAWFDRAEARRALGWPERAFIAVHVAAGDRPDLATVVEAARRTGPQALIALVGDAPGPARPGAPPDDVPNVLVAGPLPADQRALPLVAADVVVMAEPPAADRLVLPPELASCLAAARPVVAAATPGGVAQAELARAEGAAVVVPAGAADRLAQALLDLRADPARRVAMGLAGLAHAQGQLSLSRALARFDDIVDAALSAPAAALPVG
jgi:glycosyltransferase involved in cell wall biosynthesis